MIKTETLEIRKQFTHQNCTISKICGCYVDGEKNIKSTLSESFLCLPEDETFKYFDIFRKTLSGTIGKNLINMDFPTASEFQGGTQEFLMKLRDSELKDDDLIDEFYQKVIQTYNYVGNYLILLISAVYDVPFKTSDKLTVDDGSDEVYRYILCSICPVTLSKAGLSYNDIANVFQDRIRDWVVSPPSNGFLFPSFNDRSTDIHSLLYYTKDSEELQPELIDQIFGCGIPLSAHDQKETFQSLIEETLGNDCDYETIRNIHEKLNEIIEEGKSLPDPVTLSQLEVKSILEDCGVEQEKLIDFQEHYEEKTGDHPLLLATNLISTKTFELKTPDVIVKVNPERTDLVETTIINGKKYLVIEITDQVEVNGIIVNIANQLDSDQ